VLQLAKSVIERARRGEAASATPTRARSTHAKAQSSFSLSSRRHRACSFGEDPKKMRGSKSKCTPIRH
jgi:hypothetical protein